MEFSMKTKLLLLAVLFASQCGLTMFAAEERQPAQVSPAEDTLALFQQRGIAVACLNHPRCATKATVWLPAYCIEHVGGYLKELMKYHCGKQNSSGWDQNHNCSKYLRCKFSTFDKNKFDEHCQYVYLCHFCKIKFKSTGDYRDHMEFVHGFDMFGYGNGAQCDCHGYKIVD
jgi:hypothetical protein